MVQAARWEPYALGVASSDEVCGAASRFYQVEDLLWHGQCGGFEAGSGRAAEGPRLAGGTGVGLGGGGPEAGEGHRGQRASAVRSGGALRCGVPGGGDHWRGLQAQATSMGVTPITW